MFFGFSVSENVIHLNLPLYIYISYFSNNKEGFVFNLVQERAQKLNSELSYDFLKNHKVQEKNFFLKFSVFRRRHSSEFFKISLKFFQDVSEILCFELVQERARNLDFERSYDFLKSQKIEKKIFPDFSDLRRPQSSECFTMNLQLILSLFEDSGFKLVQERAQNLNFEPSYNFSKIAQNSLEHHRIHWPCAVKLLIDTVIKQYIGLPDVINW